MESLHSFFILMFAAALLVGLAQKIHLSYPLALVLGGIVIGFMPGYITPRFLRAPRGKEFESGPLLWSNRGLSLRTWTSSQISNLSTYLKPEREIGSQSGFK